MRHFSTNPSTPGGDNDPLSPNRFSSRFTGAPALPFHLTAIGAMMNHMNKRPTIAGQSQQSENSNVEVKKIDSFASLINDASLPSIADATRYYEFAPRRPASARAASPRLAQKREYIKRVANLRSALGSLKKEYEETLEVVKSMRIITHDFPLKEPKSTSEIDLPSEATKASSSMVIGEVHSVLDRQVDDLSDKIIQVIRQTYQPSVRKRKNTHGFLKRMSTVAGRNVVKRRVLKGKHRPNSV